MKPDLKKIIFLLYFAFISIPSRPQFPSLYTIVSDTGNIAEKFDSTRMGTKIFVKFNPLSFVNELNGLLKIRLPDFNNPEGVAVDIIKDKQETSGGQFAWYGKIKNQPGSFVLITQVNNIYAGHLRTNDNKLYIIEYKGNNVHKVALINQDFFKPDILTALTTKYYDNLRNVDDMRKQSSLCCDSNIIDILVLYTRDVGVSAGRQSGITPFIRHCINVTNESFIKSNISASVNVVHLSEVQYAESGSVETDRNALISGTARGLKNINDLRDRYSADVVCLIVENSGSHAFSGIAAVMDQVSPAFESEAFFVIRRDAAFADLGFAHELGHILGARHHCGMDCKLSPFPYSHGYAAGQHATIMAKEPGYLRIEYWSDTSIIFPGTGLRAGSATNSRCQQPCQAMDAACLRQTVATVSKFRCKQICPDEEKRKNNEDGIIPRPTPNVGKPETPKQNWLWFSILGTLILGAVIWFIANSKKKHKQTDI